MLRIAARSDLSPRAGRGNNSRPFSQTKVLVFQRGYTSPVT
jgi:hypothetical protein